MKQNVYLVSLGCPKNRVDSEVALTALVKAGLCPVADEKTADILLVNTCGFIEEAKEESIDVILELAQIKKERPDTRLAVMGCLTERYKEELAQTSSGGRPYFWCGRVARNSFKANTRRQNSARSGKF